MFEEGLIPCRDMHQFEVRAAVDDLPPQVPKRREPLAAAVALDLDGVRIAMGFGLWKTMSHNGSRFAYSPHWHAGPLVTESDSVGDCTAQRRK